jgi:hypothetical protein
MKKQILNSNTQAKINTTTGMSQKQAPQYEVIKLGIDWHAAQYRVVRIIDGSGPERAQRF